MKKVIFLTLFSITSYAKSFVCTTKLTNTLRLAPTTSSQKLRQLPKYTPLEVLDTQNDWLKVKGINYEGYIHSSLATNKYKCMILLNEKDPSCYGKKMSLKRKIAHRESFKVIRQEVGCNLIMAKWGHKAWVSSVNIWPEESAMLLSIP